jgi:hypothetical protein
MTALATLVEVGYFSPEATRRFKSKERSKTIHASNMQSRICLGPAEGGINASVTRLRRIFSSVGRFLQGSL